jgi:hypothetical protein
MSEFLETLKTRMEDAQVRLRVAQQNLQVAQAEFQNVAQECQSWTILVNIETQRAQAMSGAQASAPQLPLPAIEPSRPVQSGKSENNKTEAVRELLRQHPDGMTPSDLWKAVGSMMSHRPYLYSVLKRLKDKEEVTVRRGKYYLKVPPQNEVVRDHVVNIYPAHAAK